MTELEGPLVSLHLDMATKTGWVLARGKVMIASGVQEFKLRRGESLGMRFLRCRGWLMGLLEEHPIGLIVYEDPIRHHKSGAAAAVAHGLVSTLHTVVSEAGEEGRVIETMPLKPSEIKKFATGNGNASKTKMEVAAAEAGLDPIIDDNHADAFWIYKFSVHEGVLACRPYSVPEFHATRKKEAKNI